MLYVRSVIRLSVTYPAAQKETREKNIKPKPSGTLRSRGEGGEKNKNNTMY